MAFLREPLPQSHSTSLSTLFILASMFSSTLHFLNHISTFGSLYLDQTFHLPLLKGFLWTHSL